MDFSLTDEQESIVATATAFARDELAPRYRQREAEGVLDRSLVRRMGELGLIGAELPERFGGLGLDYLTSGLIMEAIARGDFNVAYVQLMGSLNAQILANNMDPEIAAEWIPRICSGEHLFALALTEPDHGSDAGCNRALRETRRRPLRPVGREDIDLAGRSGQRGRRVRPNRDRGAARARCLGFLGTDGHAGNHHDAVRRCRRARDRARLDLLRWCEGAVASAHCPRRQGVHTGHAGVRLQSRADRLAMSRRCRRITS